MKKIGIIINPHAKSVKKNKNTIVRDFINIGGDMVDIRFTEDLDVLEKVCRDFKKNGYDYIGIAGGDGTIHHVLTRLINVYLPGKLPPLLLFRSGTMDNIARDINIKGKPADVLKRLVAALKNNKEIQKTERDTIRLENHYAFIFGAGLVTNILNAAYDTETKGFARNMVVVMMAIRDAIFNKRDSTLFKRIEAAVYVDDYEVPFTDLLGIIAATVEHKGMGFRLMPRANEKAGTFHVLISGIRPMQMVRNLFKVKKGIPLKGRLNYNGLGSRLRMVSGSPVLYTLDGDLYTGGKEIIVEMGPRVELVEI